MSAKRRRSPTRRPANEKYRLWHEHRGISFSSYLCRVWKMDARWRQFRVFQARRSLKCDCLPVPSLHLVARNSTRWRWSRRGGGDECPLVDGRNGNSINICSPPFAVVERNAATLIKCRLHFSKRKRQQLPFWRRLFFFSFVFLVAVLLGISYRVSCLKADGLSSCDHVRAGLS